MRLESLGLAVFALLLAWGLHGCATSDPRSATSATTVDRPETGHNLACAWHFTRVTGGGYKYKSLVKDLAVDSGPCTVEVNPPNSKLCIGVLGGACLEIKKYIDGGLDWESEGSCRYCYINANGGMSCVIYQGSPC